MISHKSLLLNRPLFKSSMVSSSNIKSSISVREDVRTSVLPTSHSKGGCKIKCVSLRRESSKLTHFVSFTECDKITGKD